MPQRDALTTWTGQRLRGAARSKPHDGPGSAAEGARRPPLGRQQLPRNSTGDPLHFAADCQPCHARRFARRRSAVLRADGRSGGGDPGAALGGLCQPLSAPNVAPRRPARVSAARAVRRSEAKPVATGAVVQPAARGKQQRLVAAVPAPTKTPPPTSLAEQTLPGVLLTPCVRPLPQAVHYSGGGWRRAS